VSKRLGEDWTVASVASELGVSDAAIYRYFASKKAILAAVADGILADVALPTYDGDARALLSGIGRTWYAVFVRHPSFLDVDTWVGIASASSLATMEQSLSELLEAGFDLPSAAAVLGALTATSREYARHTVLAQRTDPAPVVWDANSFPTLSRAVATSPVSTVEEAFEQALCIVVDGAVQRLPRRRSDKRRSRG
jgi:AcrR family transcriptional regulator